MFSYEKRLQFPVNIKSPNAMLAQAIISQYGGPDGDIEDYKTRIESDLINQASADNMAIFHSWYLHTKPELL